MSKEKKTQNDITVKANKKGRHIMPLMNVLRCLFIPFYFLVKPFKFYGNRKVKDGACVYVLNHYTMLDPIYPAATTWEGIHFVAKKETFDAPVLGTLIRKVKGISVNRNGNDVRALLDAFKCLKNGEKVSICPEGTRNKTDAEMLPFHHGAAIFAIKTHTPIIPMVIYKKPKFFRVTHILIDEPMELTEYYDRKLTAEEIEEADNKIRNRMLEMRREHTLYLQAKKKKRKTK